MFAAYRRLTLALVRMVNAPRGQDMGQLRQVLVRPAQRQELITAARRAYKRNLAVTSTAELSLHLDGDHLAITAAGADWSNLPPQKLLVYSISSNHSVETGVRHLLWHQIVYRATPARAVLLCQLPYAMVLAGAGLIPSGVWASEIDEEVGGATTLSPGFQTDALDRAVRDYHVLLLPGQGILVWGNSVLEAVQRAEAVEYLCRLNVIARQSGLSFQQGNSFD